MIGVVPHGAPGGIQVRWGANRRTRPVTQQNRRDGRRGSAGRVDSTGAAASRGLTRRAFLRAAAVAGAAAAAPLVLPARTLGLEGTVAPSERIVAGAIGVGGRGSSDLGWMMQEADVQLVAVCDVQKPRRDAAKKAVDAKYGNADCAVYRDMRDLLAERENIDILLIATGDRWHTVAASLAMKAGKDVYCEKPSTMTIAEGQALVATAKRHGRVFQSGMQRRSEPLFVFADELARSGRLGKIHTVRAHTLPFEMKRDWLPAQPEPPRDEMDWDLWLGPAPTRPYNEGYLGGCMAWLNYYDFGTGVAGWCSHTICQCQGAIDADLTSPVAYEYPKNETAEGFTARYASGVKLVLACEGWRGSCGVRYEGTDGWVSMADGYSVPDVSSPALLEDRTKLVQEYMGKNRRPMSHMRDFLDCVRTRRQTVAHPEVAHRSMSTCHAINISMLLKRNLTWDPAKEEFAADAEANRMRSRALRQPWQV
ncbi:MAG: Gfo/Idh/MocA family oxidoreductase [Planctomycetes bacterium]|nr:Gfo/Idh/MocA family oxidoreductase [Planctomycetota bacterium]